jgi:hypothetical protein
MALCPFCSGIPDFLEPYVDPTVHTFFEIDPYCSKCGKRRYVRCNQCGGKGYTYTESLTPEYCTHCGRNLHKKVRTNCFLCKGRGEVDHICTGIGF